LYKSLEVNIFNYTKKYPAILLLVIFVAVSAIRAGEYKSDILQYKLERVYFSAGEEVNIFTGCHFAIVCGNDTVYQNQIEASYPGISYSVITDNKFENQSFNECVALIETADLDSGAVINIGLRDMDTTVAGMLFNTDSTTAGNPVNMIFNPAYENIAARFESGQLDILLSYDSSGFYHRESKPLTAPAPYFAALIPNLAKTSTTDGMLATSLYYRYSSFYLPFIFDGDRAAPVYSFYKADGTGHRAYPYDIDKGAQLFKNIDSPPQQITLSVISRNLQKTANFFADMLARDRVPVNIVDDDTDADFFIVFVPFNADSPLVSLGYIQNILSGQESSNSSQKENLTIIGNYLEAASKTTDTAVQLHYFRLADQSLKHDLGVFPLFRPGLYMTASKRVKNCVFDASGRPVITNLIKLILPTDKTEATP